MARKIEVELVGDSRNLERAFARSSRSAEQFHRKITRAVGGVAAAFGVGLGTAGIVAGIKSVVTASSNLAESVSKNRAVFGESAQAVEEWATRTSTAFGVSERSALETASSFGALFGPLGIVGRDAADQSRKLTELGADLASFYNTDVASALDAVRSGLVGESEPLRRYGILLSETRVAEEALAETHKKNASSLTAQEKVVARINLIYRDSAVAQGDFARTSEGLAGQQKILAAQIDDLKAKIGDQLRPEIIKALQATNKWLADPEHREDAVSNFAAAIQFLAAAARGAAAAIGGLNAAWDALPDFGKDKGLLDLIDKLPGGTNTSLLDLLGAKTDLFPSGGGTEPRAVRPIGLIGSRAADAATRAGGVPAAASAMADAVTRNAALVAQSAAAVAEADKAIAKGPSPNERVARRNAWFDSMIGRQLGRVQDIPTLQGQVARLGVIAGLIRARLAVTKDVTRRLMLEDQLLDVLRAQKATRAQRTQEIQNLAIDARDEKLGWLDFAIERAEDTKTLKDNRSTLRAKEKYLAGLVAHDKRNLELVSSLWRVRKQIRDLNKKNADQDPLAGLFQVSSKRMVQMLAAGTGLDLAGRHRLGANVAGMELRPINVGVHIDGREVGRATTKDNARTSRRTSRQTSGYRG